MDDVGEEGDRVADEEDRELSDGGGEQDGKAEADRPHSSPRSEDRRIHEPVGVVMAVIAGVRLGAVVTPVVGHALGGG
ncbi:hypothetical protein GCM10009798_26410 [Nocardioides panacihumi]|uniref:Uncharacterized protein n=1 Tax=Nocardioides panacihumi TaxID=400774 RepID=A0ABP5CJC0_9ACTN